jgi:hypothetical protein
MDLHWSARGNAFSRRGGAEGGSAVWEATGGRTAIPYWKLVLAEGVAQLGDCALDMIDEIMAQIEQPGWEERWCLAEILRIKGLAGLAEG